MKKITQNQQARQIIVSLRDIRGLIASYEKYLEWETIRRCAKSPRKQREASNYLRQAFAVFILECDEETEAETQLDFSRVCSLVELLADPTVVLGPPVKSEETADDYFRATKQVLQAIADLANSRNSTKTSTLKQIEVGFRSQN
jgi:hypothetical protein